MTFEVQIFMEMLLHKDQHKVAQPRVDFVVQRVDFVVKAQPFKEKRKNDIKLNVLVNENVCCSKLFLQIVAFRGHTRWWSS